MKILPRRPDAGRRPVPVPARVRLATRATYTRRADPLRGVQPT